MSEHRLGRRAHAGGAGARPTALPASEAADWRQRLLANVSHELRTPLNAIIGFSEMLASPELAPRDAARQREYARIINASGQHLLSVVNTLLDMSKIESGVFAIEPEHFDLGALVDFSCDLVKLKAREKNIELLAVLRGRTSAKSSPTSAPASRSCSTCCRMRSSSRPRAAASPCPRAATAAAWTSTCPTPASA